MLELIGNNFTVVGIQSLFDAMHSSGTLNSVHDANHDLFGEFKLNEFDDPVDNRITKLLSMIFICKCNLDDEVLPPELVPRFLVLLQAGRRINNSEFNPFNTLFWFICNGFMSLLNTRKHKVWKCSRDYQRHYKTLHDLSME